jgi:hypothetical protein
MVCQHRHQAFSRHQDSVCIRRLRASGHLRISFRRQHPTGAGGLRGERHVQAVQVSGPSGICVSPRTEFERIDRFRGHPDRWRFHHFRQERATCSRSPATTCISSSTKAAASAHRAGSAPRCSRT